MLRGINRQDIFEEEEPTPWSSPHAAQAAGGSTPAAATKKKQTEIKHFNINNKIFNFRKL